MTLVELQNVLGKYIEDLSDDREPYENKKRIAEMALTVSAVAKQMINNADVVLRASKLAADSKLDSPEIMNMVNGGYVLMRKGENGELSGKTIG